MDFKFGTVSQIVDDHKFIIKFTIRDYIEDAIAYPVNQKDEPNVGDPIIIMEIETIFGFSFMYQKMRLKDHTRMKLLQSIVSIYDDHVEIHAGGPDKNDKYDEAKSLIWINNDGTILVKSEDSVTIETKTCLVKAEDSATIETKTCTLQANDVNITGGNLTTVNGGQCTPTGSGGFCAIPICPLSGAPHIGNQIKGT